MEGQGKNGSLSRLDIRKKGMEMFKKVFKEQKKINA